MPTSSILKTYIVRSDEACDRLIEVLNGKTTRKRTSCGKYAEGKRILKRVKQRKTLQ